MAVVFLGILPGLAWIRVMAPRLRGAPLVALSVVTSVALMTLALQVGNALFGLPITASNAVRESIALTIAALAVPVARFFQRMLTRET